MINIDLKDLNETETWLEAHGLERDIYIFFFKKNVVEL